MRSPRWPVDQLTHRHRSTRLSYKTAQRVEKVAELDEGTLSRMGDGLVCAPWKSPYRLIAGPEKTQRRSRRASSLPTGPCRRPQPVATSHRLRFCPAATSSASIFTLSKPRQRNCRKPCHCFASPNSGSTHTERLRIALA